MSTISSNLLRQYPRSLLLILGIGLVMRMSFIAFHQRPLISDEKEYDRLAYTLATKGIYSYDGTPTAYRPVGYPAFIGVAYFIAGHSPFFVKILQGLLDILTALLLYHLLDGFKEQARLLAAAFWTFYPPAILYANFLMSETLFTFLLVTFFVLLRSFDSNPPFRNFLLGALLGILILIKPSLILFLLVLPLLFVKIKFSLKRAAIVGAGFLIFVAPWFMRNYGVSGNFSLSSNGGVNLLIGNNPNTTGAYAINYPEDIFKDAKNEFEADQLAYRYATNYIIQHPVAFMTNGCKKLAHLFESEGGVLVWSFHDSPEDTSTRYAAKYASLSLLLIIFVNAPYAALLLLGAMGFIAAPKDKLWWLVFSFFTCWIITHIIFFGGGRFHFPLMPFFTLFTAYFLASGIAVFSKINAFGKASAAVAIMFILSVWIYEAIILLKV